MKDLKPRLTFLDLPPEIRNYIYQHAVPSGIRFTASQRMRDMKDERNLYFPKMHLPRVLVVKFENDRGPTGQLLRLCKNIRAEVLPLFEANVTGTFEFWLATNFKLVPQALRDRVDHIVFRRCAVDRSKSQYVLRFPNLKTFTITTLVTTPSTRLTNETAIASEIEYQCQKIIKNIPRRRRDSPYKDLMIPDSWRKRLGKHTLNVKFLEEWYVIDHILLNNPNNDPWNGFHLIFDYIDRKCIHASAQKFVRLEAKDFPPDFDMRSIQSNYLNMAACWRVLPWIE